MNNEWVQRYFGEDADVLATNCIVVKDKLGRTFVAGTPEDEHRPEGEGHSCDEMGCASTGPHIILVK